MNRNSDLSYSLDLGIRGLAGVEAAPESKNDGKTMDDEEERNLVLAAQGGNADAIRELYDTYRRRIWTVVLYSLGNHPEAQDVLQTVFFKVFRNLRRFQYRSSLFTWIYRIARNECLNHLRRHVAPQVPLEAIMGSRDEIDPKLGASGHVGRIERDFILQQAVKQLPYKLREVIVLKYLEGLSYGEISRTIGCAPGTVASRLNRALSELGERLGPFQRLL